MNKDYSSSTFDDCYNWLKKKYNKKKYTDEQLMMACKDTEAELSKFLESKAEDDEWPEFTNDKWKEFARFCVNDWKNTETCTIPSSESVSGVSDREAPRRDGTAWQKYKNYLLHGSGFSRSAVENIERSALNTLNFLKDDTRESGQVVKGLIVGNVQSGKTANMAALISMAADYGWNLFIILTGTIENLRLQTQTRFNNDLQNGNLSWDFLVHPGSGRRDGVTELSSLDVTKGTRFRYVTCCLKNVSRLQALQKWLNSDANVKQKLRILLIDDEADQASLNTGDIGSDKERTAINRCIRDIVNNTNTSPTLRLSNIEKENLDTPYLSMNYVCYTATPYGNFLNESGEDSLYPRDFISVLTPSDLYFGPKQIFGNGRDNDGNSLPILNIIPGSYQDGSEGMGDIGLLEAVCEDPGSELPESLKEAVAWFCVAAAIQREWKYKKPVTMLVHHSMRTGKHAGLGRGIYMWIRKTTETDFLTLCKKVYDEQTAQFSKSVFEECWPEYGQFSGIDEEHDIRDYPDFDSLTKHLIDLKSGICHIEMDQSGAFIFGKGIHLCVDNCKNEVVTDGDFSHSPYVRLIYPQKEEYNGYAPAFLVIGGNTLSRGLTLEGLVCTYFSREVKQADSLMQMARWFGFRRGYELLPRIWLTEMAQKRFEFLTLLDEDLRTDLYKYQGQMSPADCSPLIMQTPAAVRMLLTNKNKSQSQVDAVMDFSGANLQTFNFINDKTMLEEQLKTADSFIDALPAPAFEENGRRIVWEQISFDMIWENLLQYIKWPFTHTMDIHDFKKWYEAISHNHLLNTWDVVLAGKKTDRLHQWHGVGKINRTRKISGMNTADSRHICIGVLSDPNEWCSDLQIQSGKKFPVNLSEEEKIEIRKKYGKENVPLLVLYCIDKDSRPGKAGSVRQPLNTFADVIGVSIHIPGQRLNKSYCVKVKMDLDDNL